MLRNRPFLLAGLLLLLGLCILLGAFVYHLPPVYERLGWRVSQWRAQLQYAISPPEEAVFTPNPTVAAMVQETMAALSPTPTLSPPTATPGPTATPTITPTPTPEPTPLPDHVQLTGIRHEYQRWNNCGPANLAMALSYWGWEGDQRPIAAYVKPNPRDKNVMPYEMADYVTEATGLRMLVRAGGELALLKSLLAAGFPVIVEKGFEGPGFDGWMGHYGVISGYDDTKGQFTIQDSYYGPNIPMSYDDLERYWRHFNYTYLIPYSADLEQSVLQLLGPFADETYSIEYAAQKASDEIFRLSGREQFFAWFNRGTSLMSLQDYGGAAAAYDQAFQIDARLATDDPEHRPWRILWYQTGPYWAYYYTGRYYDVLNLANFTIENMSEPAVEESFYWRALAKEALGDIPGAIEDLRKALKWHPDWIPALQQLDRLGATP